MDSLTLLILDLLGNIAKAALPTLLGFLLGYSIKDKKDRKYKRLESVCEQARELGSSSLVYWAAVGSDKTAESEIKKGFSKLSLLVAEIKYTRRQLPLKMSISEVHGDFFDLATGGEFAKKNKHRDADRGKKCVELASRLVREISRLE